MSDTITILITGTGGGLLAGTAYVLGKVQGAARYKSKVADAWATREQTLQLAETERDLAKRAWKGATDGAISLTEQLDSAVENGLRWARERDALQAELTRLTDRDEHGRYVRNEPLPVLEVVTHPKFGDVLVTPKLGGTSARSGVRASSPKPIKPKA